MKTLTTLLLLGCTLLSTAQIDLKYNLKKGETFKIKTIADQQINQEVMGQSMETSQVFSQGTLFEVIGATNGVFDIKCTYYSISMAISAMGMEMSYDSETGEGEGEPMAQVFSALLGKSFTMKMNSTGKVIGMSGIDAMLDEIVKAASDDPMERENMKTQIADQFGEEALSNNMSQAFQFFPEKVKIKQGESWSYAMNLGVFDVELNNTYTLTEFTDKEAKLGIKSTLENASFSQAMNGVEMDMELSGTQEGSLTIDRNSGMLLKGEIKQNLKAKANAMGMEIPMTIVSVNKFIRE